MLILFGTNYSVMAETRTVLSGDQVETLRELALLGAMEGETKLSCSGLAERLDVSTQTASRRLQNLEQQEFIDRDVVGDGQWVVLSDRGARRLEQEYEAYRHIFEDPPAVELTGSVTSGMGEGKHYISLPGYMEQFREKLGYEPFPGTLNIDLNETSIRERPRLDALEPVTIEGWEDEDRTYGPAYCYRVQLVTPAGEYEQAHLIAPERTHHGDDNLEVIAPEELRAVLELTDGTEVTVRVAE